MIRQVIIPGRRFNRQDFRGEGRGHGSGRRVKRAAKAPSCQSPKRNSPSSATFCWSSDSAVPFPFPSSLPGQPE